MNIPDVDNQTVIIFALACIAVSLIFSQSSAEAMAIINSICSGLLGMGMAKVVK